MGIRHTVPAGLPTGTSAGKVAGDDWRADHVHVPFEIAMFLGTAATAAAAASAAVGIECIVATKCTRNRLDLSQATQVRLVGMVIANGNNTTAAIKLQTATTEAATWSASTGLVDAGASIVLGTGTAGVLRDSGWQTLNASSRVDNVTIAAVVASAFGTTAPTLGSLTVLFR